VNIKDNYDDTLVLLGKLGLIMIFSFLILFGIGIIFVFSLVVSVRGFISILFFNVKVKTTDS